MSDGEQSRSRSEKAARRRKRLSSYEGEEFSSKLKSLSVPVPPNEWLRLSTLTECDVLDSDPRDEDFDRYTAMCARMFNVPICLVSFVDLDRVWIKSKFGTDVEEVHRDIAFSSHSILPECPDVLVIPDCGSDPRFQQNPLVTCSSPIMFYAGAALVIDGIKIGTLCIMDRVSNVAFSLQDQKNLLDVAAIVSQVISSRRSQFLREQKRQSQQFLSLKHNLRTPCTSLEISVKSLISDLNDAISGNDLSYKTDQLVQLVSSFTDLCGLMPSLADPEAHVLQSDGYSCDMAVILEHMHVIMQCFCENVCLDVKFDPILTKDAAKASYTTFPELLTVVSLTLVRMYAALSSDIFVTIGFKENSEVESLQDFKDGTIALYNTAGWDARSHSGMVVFDLSARDCADDAIQHTVVAFSKHEERLRTIGGGSCLTASDDSTLNYRFWLPLSVSPVAATSQKSEGKKTRNRSRSISPRYNALLIGGDLDPLQAMLEASGCNVCVKANGRLGLNQYRHVVENCQKQYDFIFINLLMPVMHGGEVMQEISKLNKEINYSSLDCIFVGIICEGDDVSAYFEKPSHQCNPMTIVSTPSGVGSFDEHSRRVGIANPFDHVLKKPISPLAVTSILSGRCSNEGMSEEDHQNSAVFEKPAKRFGPNWFSRLFSGRRGDSRVAPAVM